MLTDPEFWPSLWVTFKFSGLCLICELTIGLGLAVIFSERGVQDRAAKHADDPADGHRSGDRRTRNSESVVNSPPPIYPVGSCYRNNRYHKSCALACCSGKIFAQSDNVGKGEISLSNCR